MERPSLVGAMSAAPLHILIPAMPNYQARTFSRFLWFDGWPRSETTSTFYKQQVAGDG